MINTPDWARPKICVQYPSSNETEFERWFFENYEGDITEREYLPIFFCGYQVNHDYGNDKQAMQRLQDYVDSLPNDKKYHVISQYDNGVGVDWKGKDVLEFNMSKKGENMYPLPLIGEPYPYIFTNPEKKYLANFVGGLTHPIREHAKSLMGKEGYYISFDRHDPYEYCKILSESVFTLCYRGYGINSFRIAEALQYGSLPIYISDDFIHPHKIRFNAYGVMIDEKDLQSAAVPIFNDLDKFSNDTLMRERFSILPAIYEKYYTYEGTRNKILQHLQTIK